MTRVQAALCPAGVEKEPSSMHQPGDDQLRQQWRLAGNRLRTQTSRSPTKSTPPITRRTRLHEDKVAQVSTRCQQPNFTADVCTGGDTQQPRDTDSANGGTDQATARLQQSPKGSPFAKWVPRLASPRPSAAGATATALADANPVQACAGVLAAAASELRQPGEAIQAGTDVYHHPITSAETSRRISGDDTAPGARDQQSNDQQETTWQRLKRLSAMRTHLDSQRLGTAVLHPQAQQPMQLQPAPTPTQQQQSQAELLNSLHASRQPLQQKQQQTPSAQAPHSPEVHTRRRGVAAEPGALGLSIVGSPLKSTSTGAPQHPLPAQLPEVCHTQKGISPASSLDPSHPPGMSSACEPPAYAVIDSGGSADISRPITQARPGQCRGHAPLGGSVGALITLALPLPAYQAAVGLAGTTLNASEHHPAQLQHRQLHHGSGPTTGGAPAAVRVSWQAADVQVAGEERVARYAAELAELDSQLQAHAPHSRHSASNNTSSRLSPRRAPAASLSASLATSNSAGSRPGQGSSHLRQSIPIDSSTNGASVRQPVAASGAALLDGRPASTSTVALSHPLLASMWAELPPGAGTGAAVAAAASTSTLEMEAEAMLARVHAAVTGRSHGHSRSHGSMADLDSGLDQSDHTTSIADASGHHAGRQQPASRVSARAVPGGGAKAAAIRQGVVSAFSGMVGDLEEGGRADLEGGLEATVRRIMEGAQLQILELQYQERQSQLQQGIESYQQGQSQLEQQEAEAGVSHQQGQQQWSRGADGVHATTHPHHEQLAAWEASSLGGAESSQGGGIHQQQGTAAALPLWASVRCKLLLRRWWRTVRGQRQWARKVIVYMAADRLRRVLHAWHRAAHREKVESMQQARCMQSEAHLEQVGIEVSVLETCCRLPAV
jgi:hypothetical protein